MWVTILLALILMLVLALPVKAGGILPDGVNEWTREDGSICTLYVGEEGVALDCDCPCVSDCGESEQQTTLIVVDEEEEKPKPPPTDSPIPTDKPTDEPQPTPEPTDDPPKEEKTKCNAGGGNGSELVWDGEKWVD